MFAPALRRVARTCELVHGLVEPWLPLVALATPPGVPLVQTAHGSWAVHPLRRRLVRHVFASALARTDLLVCQSRATRDAVLALSPTLRCEVISGGVDPEAFARSPGVKPSGWPGRGRVVLSVGAMKPRKGHAVALEAFARLAAVHDDLHWVVVGGLAPAGGYMDELRRRVESLRLVERVHWLSDLTDDEMVACYRLASVFLLLPVTHMGSFEGLGLVYLEAAAAGLPAVGTLESGAVDAIADGETGFLVPPGNAPAAAAAVDRLLCAPELAQEFGRAARTRATRMSWTGLAQQLAVRYRELLQRRGGVGDVDRQSRGTL